MFLLFLSLSSQCKLDVRCIQCLNQHFRFYLINLVPRCNHTTTFMQNGDTASQQPQTDVGSHLIIINSEIEGACHPRR